ncbi:D-alanine--D-alanine ligase family protein [soil metagenome]
MTGSGQERRKRVGVIFGGRSAEHDVSLRSALTIMGALIDAGHDVVPIGITREGQWLTSGDPMSELQAGSPLFQIAESAGHEHGNVEEAVESLSLAARGSASRGLVPANGWAGEIDVIFPALHGPMGEDGTVQGLFELAGVPYVGAGVLASSVAMDKALCKQVLDQAGIPQAPWVTTRRRDWNRNPDGVIEVIESLLGFPCFIKPANLGSSIGISKARSRKELIEGLDEACLHDRRIVIEKGLDARELEVSVLGNDDPIASVVGEVIPGENHEFYDYEAKYVDDDADLVIPADIPESISQTVRRLAVAAFKEIDCAGIARVDFLLDRHTGDVYLNELNTLPGFTSISMYPKLWEATGVPLAELVDRLLELALERADDRRGA